MKINPLNVIDLLSTHFKSQEDVRSPTNEDEIKLANEFISILESGIPMDMLYELELGERDPYDAVEEEEDEGDRRKSDPRKSYSVDQMQDILRLYDAGGLQKAQYRYKNIHDYKQISREV